MNAKQTLIVPGYANSGPGHWQTRWEALDPTFVRVAMPDWDRPVCDDWCDALDRAISAGGSQPVRIAAHSLGCLTVAAWAARSRGRAGRAALNVAGALLVAVPDPHGAEFPSDASGYEHVPMEPLPFPTIVVASSDDPYGGVPFAQRCAKAWASRFIDIGPRGHINAQSGLGDWPEGLAWLASLDS